MKKQKAITLISLVITIILLIILVGVTINLSLGENGILSRAKYAKEKYLNEQEKEEKSIDELYSQLLVATGDNSKITISEEDLRTLITEQVKETLKKENTSTVPAGTVISYMGNNVPGGYLSCDGAEYNISEYPNLAEQIKTEFGSYNYYGGDGTTTFAVPDLRGEFLRGTGTNSHQSGCDGATVGEHQDGSDVVGGYFGSTNGTLYVGEKMYHTNMNTKSDNWSPNTGGANIFNRNRTESSSYSDTIGKGISRPTNTSVLYCIKY